MKYFRNRKIREKRKDKASQRPLTAQILSNNMLVVTVAVVVFIGTLLLSNLCLQLINSFFEYASGLTVNNLQNRSFSLPDIFSFSFEKYTIYYVVSIIVALVLSIKTAYRLKLNFASLVNNQKGSRQWATVKELKKEYRSIPEKDKFYDGKPGFPISRYENKIFIDDSPVNNLIIGTTRSGKGELFVFPTIDIYSRAKNQQDRASFIISDSKGELATASKETLERRGYNVQILDIDKFNGMSYNPLEIIKNLYIEGDHPAAQMLTRTLSHILFNDPTAHDKVWQNWSIALCNALILATIIDCCAEADRCSDVEEKEEWYNKINMYSVTRLLTDYGTVPEEGESELDKFFNARAVGDLAKIEYSAVLMAQGVTKGSIFASTLAILVKFTAVNIAKMGAKNTLDLKSIGFDKDQPTAIFMVIPDNDTSCHFLVTMFISQLYYMLVRTGKEKGNGGKCSREVVFLLDEFGNILPIPEMSNIINVCLGRNIRFDLIIQAYSQIDKLYGKDDARSIIGACANQIYLLTIEYETAEMYSKLIGNETITVRSRSGEALSIHKSFSEQVETKPLCNPNELMELMPGENIVCRVTKRNDITGEKIIPNPIKNNNKTIMKYRYEYLSETFDNSKSFGDMHLENTCKHKNLRLSSYLYRPIGVKEKVIDKWLIGALISDEDIEEINYYFTQEPYNLGEKEIYAMTVDEVIERLQDLHNNEYISDKIYQTIFMILEEGGQKNATEQI